MSKKYFGPKVSNKDGAVTFWLPDNVRFFMRNPKSHPKLYPILLPGDGVLEPSSFKVFWAEHPLLSESSI